MVFLLDMQTEDHSTTMMYDSIKTRRIILFFFLLLTNAYMTMSIDEQLYRSVEQKFIEQNARCVVHFTTGSLPAKVGKSKKILLEINPPIDVSELNKICVKGRSGRYDVHLKRNQQFLIA